MQLKQWGFGVQQLAPAIVDTQLCETNNEFHRVSEDLDPQFVIRQLEIYMVTELLVPFDSNVRRVKRIVLDDEAQDTLGMIAIGGINTSILILLRVFVLIEHALVPVDLDHFGLLSLDKVKIGQILILIIRLVNIAHRCVLLRGSRSHLAHLILRDTVLVVDLLLV